MGGEFDCRRRDFSESHAKDSKKPRGGRMAEGDRLSRWRAGAFGPFAISERFTAKPPLNLTHEKWPKTAQPSHF
jgi:hypothetical protein